MSDSEENLQTGQQGENLLEQGAESVLRSIRANNRRARSPKLAARQETGVTKKYVSLILVTSFALFSFASLRPAGVKDFYRGKTIRFVVGAPAGGG